jgi:hypothetical protein
MLSLDPRPLSPPAAPPAPSPTSVSASPPSAPTPSQMRRMLGLSLRGTSTASIIRRRGLSSSTGSPASNRWATKYLWIQSIPQCMSPRRNWDSSNPSSASECAPRPFKPKSGGTAHSPAYEGVGSPNSDDWRKGLALCLLCEVGR